ncbi:sigma factor-like helix-turn-helix DNA-binding protein [Algiphilus sp.]|uniref:sigma factor-like helix-turn-helix DNA-binding protein n=1 Tax=Algiphilus sp. TaxID=1872431 RepID=UPI003B520979
MMAAGLRQQSGIKRVDVLPPGDGFGRALRATAARCFVVDCGSLPLIRLTDLLDAIRGAQATASLLVLAPQDREIMRAALRHGATALISASDPMERCLEALRQLEQGHSWLPADLVGELLNGHQVPRPQSAIDQLPPRQRQIFDLIGSGMSTRDIATLLGIGVKTVETHRMRLMQQLGLRTAHDLVVRAVQAKSRSA